MSFGGFMGLGHSHYPLPWKAIKYDGGREGYITNVTEDQLKDAPEFSDESWTDRDWEARWHRHFQAPPYWDEDVAKQAYEEALVEDLPADVEAIVRRQYQGVTENHERIRELRNLAARTS